MQCRMRPDQANGHIRQRAMQPAQAAIVKGYDSQRWQRFLRNGDAGIDQQCKDHKQGDIEELRFTLLVMVWPWLSRLSMLTIHCQLRTKCTATNKPTPKPSHSWVVKPVDCGSVSTKKTANKTVSMTPLSIVRLRDSVISYSNNDFLTTIIILVTDGE
jgi:hypothetical protein